MIRYQSVVLLCSDIAISKQFYQDLFQLEIELDIGGLVTFVGGISLWEKKDALYLLYPGSDTITNPEKPAQELYFETDEIVEFSTILQERKVPLLHEIQVTPWNQRTIRFFDPDRNLIEVGESMEHVVKNLGKDGLPPEKIAEKTWMPLEYIKMILQ
ncbi:VOC family protein [Methanospirillum sp.]